MRKVTEKTAMALRDLKKTTSGNTKVVVDEVGARMYLHGNLIAVHELGILSVHDAGWQTNTTKERLNGILRTFGIHARIFQRNGEWLLQYTDTMVNVAWNNAKSFEV